MVRILMIAVAVAVGLTTAFGTGVFAGGAGGGQAGAAPGSNRSAWGSGAEGSIRPPPVGQGAKFQRTRPERGADPDVQRNRDAYRDRERYHDPDTSNDDGKGKATEKQMEPDVGN